ASLSLFYFTPTAPTEFYTLSLHDALPISVTGADEELVAVDGDAPGVRSLRVHRAVVADVTRLGIDTEDPGVRVGGEVERPVVPRSEEHTSELQSRENLVCRLLLEKKKKK